MRIFGSAVLQFIMCSISIQLASIVPSQMCKLPMLCVLMSPCQMLNGELLTDHLVPI